MIPLSLIDGDPIQITLRFYTGLVLWAVLTRCPTIHAQWFKMEPSTNCDTDAGVIVIVAWRDNKISDSFTHRETHTAKHTNHYDNRNNSNYK